MDRDAFSKLVQRMVDDPCAFYQANPDLSGTLVHLRNDSYSRSSFTSEEFSVMSRWDIVWNAKLPVDDGYEGYLTVELFDGDDRNARSPQRPVQETFAAPDNLMRQIRKSEGRDQPYACESVVVDPFEDQVGRRRYFVKVHSNVPFDVIVRQR